MKRVVIAAILTAKNTGLCVVDITEKYTIKHLIEKPTNLVEIKEGLTRNLQTNLDGSTIPYVWNFEVYSNHPELFNHLRLNIKYPQLIWNNRGNCEIEEDDLLYLASAINEGIVMAGSDLYLARIKGELERVNKDENGRLQLTPILASIGLSIGRSYRKGANKIPLAQTSGGKLRLSQVGAKRENIDREVDLGIRLSPYRF